MTVSGGTADSWLAALRGGSLPAAAVGVVDAVVFGVLDGVAGALSALAGMALALVALGVGPLLARRARRLSAPGVMAVAVAGYGGVVLVLGLAFALLGQFDGLNGPAVGISLLTCAFAWTIGQLRAVVQLRVLAFGGLQEDGEPADRVSEGGTR